MPIALCSSDHLITKARRTIIIWPACTGDINTPPTIHGWKPNTAMHGSATVRTFSPTVFPAYRSSRAKPAASKRLGRPVGAPQACHPCTKCIETARVLLGGRLLGPSPGRALPSKALLHT